MVNSGEGLGTLAAVAANAIMRPVRIRVRVRISLSHSY
jgi:hypothetical protein